MEQRNRHPERSLAGFWRQTESKDPEEARAAQEVRRSFITDPYANFRLPHWQMIHRNVLYRPLESNRSYIR
jgi:hypothetical protein